MTDALNVYGGVVNVGVDRKKLGSVVGTTVDTAEK